MKANYKMPVAALASVILGALAMMLSVIAAALAQDTVRVRGTIERIDGSTYMVKARDGTELKVTLADSPQIAGVVKASLSDIKQGSFVGITGMPRPDGIRIDAGNWRRTLPMGPSTPEHDDQCERSTNRHGG